MGSTGMWGTAGRPSIQHTGRWITGSEQVSLLPDALGSGTRQGLHRRKVGEAPRR